MKIGYARVSTKKQSLERQTYLLKKAGCEIIFQEKESRTKDERADLKRLLEQLRSEDIVYVVRLSRLGGSLKQLLRIIEEIHNKGAQFVSLQEPIDTTTAQGKLVFSIMAALSQFNRDLISERTLEGLQAARQRGRKGGRPQGLSDKNKHLAIFARSLYNQKQHTILQIMEITGIKSKATIYKYIKLNKQD